jgi:A/G-specific adenine glycosylase
VLVRRCGEAERWAGLWDFPRVTLAPGPARDWPAVAAAVWQLCGVRLAAGEPLARLHHGVTRFRITLECYSAQWRSGAPSPAARVRWLPPAELAELPLSTTGRRLARLIVAPVR